MHVVEQDMTSELLHICHHRYHIYCMVELSRNTPAMLFSTRIVTDNTTKVSWVISRPMRAIIPELTLNFFYLNDYNSTNYKIWNTKTDVNVWRAQLFVINVRALRWRHNGRHSVSNHQPHDCLLNRLFRPRSKKTSKLRVTGLCVGNSPGTGELPAQMASNAENVSLWWRHHGLLISIRSR